MNLFNCHFYAILVENKELLTGEIFQNSGEILIFDVHLTSILASFSKASADDALLALTVLAVSGSYHRNIHVSQGQRIRERSSTGQHSPSGNSRCLAY